MIDEITKHFSNDYMIEISNSKKSLKIKEDKNTSNNSLKGIEIVKLYEKVYAIKLDAFDKQFVPVFAKSALHINKACDCILFYGTGENIDILFIELKSKDLDMSAISFKFKSSNSFIKYYFDLIKSVYDLEIKYKIHNIVFTTDSLKAITKKKQYYAISKYDIKYKLAHATKGNNIRNINIASLL